jgi:hypothetical protein
MFNWDSILQPFMNEYIMLSLEITRIFLLNYKFTLPKSDIKNTNLWCNIIDMILCSLVSGYQRLGGAYYLLLPPLKVGACVPR